MDFHLNPPETEQEKFRNWVKDTLLEYEKRPGEWAQWPRDGREISTYRWNELIDHPGRYLPHNCRIKDIDGRMWVCWTVPEKSKVAGLPGRIGESVKRDPTWALIIGIVLAVVLFFIVPLLFA